MKIGINLKKEDIFKFVKKCKHCNMINKLSEYQYFGYSYCSICHNIIENIIIVKDDNGMEIELSKIDVNMISKKFKKYPIGILKFSNDIFNVKEPVFVDFSTETDIVVYVDLTHEYEEINRMKHRLLWEVNNLETYLYNMFKFPFINYLCRKKIHDFTKIKSFIIKVLILSEKEISNVNG